MSDFIPMADLEDRQVYRIRSRNLVVGVWVAASKGFIGIREKFGDLYLFEEYHHETGAPYGTAHAIHALPARVPEEVSLTEHMVDADGEWIRTEDGYIQNNQPLFDLMRPFDLEINAQLVEETRLARIEAESKRWAPKTLKQHERDERIEAANSWRRAQLAAIDGVPDPETNKAIWAEYRERMMKAMKTE